MQRTGAASVLGAGRQTGNNAVNDPLNILKLALKPSTIRIQGAFLEGFRPSLRMPFTTR